MNDDSGYLKPTSMLVDQGDAGLLDHESRFDISSFVWYRRVRLLHSFITTYIEIERGPILTPLVRFRVYVGSFGATSVKLKLRTNVNRP